MSVSQIICSNMGGRLELNSDSSLFTIKINNEESDYNSLECTEENLDFDTNEVNVIDTHE